jgi:hypothetical protein
MCGADAARAEHTRWRQGYVAFAGSGCNAAAMLMWGGCDARYFVPRYAAWRGENQNGAAAPTRLDSTSLSSMGPAAAVRSSKKARRMRRGGGLDSTGPGPGGSLRATSAHAWQAGAGPAAAIPTGELGAKAGSHGTGRLSLADSDDSQI